MTDWSIADSRETYSLKNWGEGYVDINTEGHLSVRPFRAAEAGEIDLKALVDDCQDQGISLPVLIRFQDILKDRLSQLCGAFKEAFKEHDYQSNYTAVYPIKVNQQFSVVAGILEQGDGCVGLEAGSKPELMAVLSVAEAGKHIVICNGYKDREYIRLALIAKRLGLQIYIVLEKVSELALVLEEARDLKIEPLLGLRLKLASMGKGKWQNTGGEKAKFGLTAEQILNAVETLQSENCIHWIRLLHFHMGSQIANLSDIETGLAEAAQYFIELHKLDVAIDVLDIGGGMGVDYEGSASNSEFSVDYSLGDYANAVTRSFSEACARYQIKQPAIVTESGRAMTAHHAVLVTDVVNAEQHCEIIIEKNMNVRSELLEKAYSVYEESQLGDPVLVFKKVNALYQQAQLSFVNNEFSISERAELEKIYLACCHRLKKNLSHDVEEQQTLLDFINEKLADKFVCNLSIFQSVPDVWGISQIFPIVPLQYLDQQPNRRAIIQDLTCDSDGQIEKYVDRYGIETSLPVHQIKEDEKYLLGIFMVGAYQEILGDMHNLFGDTNTVDVILDEKQNYKICDTESGDSVSELLNYVHFNTDEMLNSFQSKVDAAGLTSTENKMYFTELKHGLEGYTYMED